jgi:hypothetical protein
MVLYPQHTTPSKRLDLLEAFECLLNSVYDERCQRPVEEIPRRCADLCMNRYEEHEDLVNIVSDL